jgi:hypothetical protein
VVKITILAFLGCVLGGFVGGLLLAVVVVNSVSYFTPSKSLATIGRSR